MRMKEILERKVKFMKWTLPIWVLIAIGLTSTVGLAIWIGGFSITGSFLATSGSKSAEQTETWDLDIIEAENYSQNFTYVNADGPVAVTYTLTDNIVSSDISCNYEPDVDIRFELEYEGVACQLTAEDNCGYTMVSGDNVMNVTITPSEFRCPLTGDWGVSFAV